MKVLATESRARWGAFAAYTAGIAALGAALRGGVRVGAATAAVDFAHGAVVRAAAATAWAPLAWNVFPRLEYRSRALSRLVGGNRDVAHLLFAGYIMAFSALRERLFFAAIAGTPQVPLEAGAAAAAGAADAVAAAAVTAGMALSGAGFWHLGVRFTYMGEYFGFRMPKLVTAFPFNVTADPMYHGSALMHVGYALRASSPAGLFLAAFTAYTYWVAARIFEEPFMVYCYSGQAEKDEKEQ